MQHIKSIMIFAGDSAGHYITHDAGAWVIRHRHFEPVNVEKTYSNIISALSALERVSRVPSSLFEVGYPDFATIPILRRAG